MQRNLLVLIFLCALFSCTPRLQKRFCTIHDVRKMEVGERPQRPRNPSYEFSSYVPDTNHIDHFPMKYIRVNFHLMNSKDSLHHYDEVTGKAWALEYLKAVNYALNKNVKALLPEGNDLPVLPVRYQYVLTPKPYDPQDSGIYFHYDDDLYYYIVKGRETNIYDTRVFEKYGVQKDTVLNIFLMPHHPDSVQSKTYGAYGTGVALGKFIKMGWIFSKNAQLSPWDIRGTLNHEVGHIYSLVHAWAYNDGCDDTPRHDLSVPSSNLMDYNSSQLSFTPCQIGKIHERMSTLESTGRKFLVPNWCTLHEDRHIFISDTIHWQGQKDLEGNLTIRDGGQLKISCRVSLPKGAKIVVEPGGQLILENCRLHNACGDKWQGIELQNQKSKAAEVVFIGSPKLDDMENLLE